MQKDKTTSRKSRINLSKPPLLSVSTHRPEPALLEFLDTFSLTAFMFDTEYRRRLNLILDSFTDEEFDDFEIQHARRFTLN